MARPELITPRIDNAVGCHTLRTLRVLDNERRPR
jgi:hypothetical protein